MEYSVAIRKIKSRNLALHDETRRHHASKISDLEREYRMTFLAWGYIKTY